MLVVLPRHLLLRRQHRLDRAEVDEDVARVAALLDDARRRCRPPAAELAEDVLVLGVAQALQDDLPRGRRRDPAEAVGGVVALAHAVPSSSVSGAQTVTCPVLRSSSTRACGCAPSVRW